MEDTLYLVAIVYGLVALRKGWLIAQTTGMFLSSIMRARYRVLGVVTLRYFVVTSVCSILIFALSAAVWPIVLFSEGRFFWRPYNKFSTARNSMRILRRR